MPERTTSYLPRGKNEASLAYNVRLDVADYQNLFQQQDGLTPQEFARRKTQLNTLKKHNLESLLGERFNAEVLQVTYHLINGQLFNTDHDEPFLEIVKRGQKHREQHGSQEIEREKAEVTGFAKMSRILLDSQAESFPERKIIIISPRGGKHSIYQHNFFDVYQKTPDGQILMSRYTCKLSYDEFYEAASIIDPFNQLPQNPADADFLATPLVAYKSLDQIQEIFHPQEETMNQKEYQQLLESCQPLIACYLRTLTNPDFSGVTKIYNALLNYADEIISNLGSDPLNPIKTTLIELNKLKGRTLNIEGFVSFYGNRPVRQVTTACGISGSSLTSTFSSLSLFSPFSVAEFGLRSNGCPDCNQSENHFHCPGCGGQISSGQGITTCPHCGLTKEQAGSKCE